MRRRFASICGSRTSSGMELMGPAGTDAALRDWVLVGALMVTALLEGVLRDDVAWRPVATIVAVGLAPVLLGLPSVRD